MAKFIDRIGKTLVSLGNSLVTKSAPTSMNVNGRAVNNYQGFTQLIGFGSLIAEKLDCTTPEGLYNVLYKCPPVGYILYKKALMFTNGRLCVKDKRTGVEITDYSKFIYTSLLAQPNVLQSDIQFRAQIIMYIQAFGYCPVYKVRGSFNRITALHILPTNLCTFYKSGRIFHQITYSSLWDSIKFNGTEINKEDIYVFTDITPYFDTSLLPASRLRQYSKVVTSIAENYNARLSLLKTRGSKGILSNKTSDANGHISLSKTEIEQLQSDFKKYEINGGDYDVIVSNKELLWQNMTLPLKDMLLTEQEEHDIMTLCDALGYEHMLLSRGSDATYTNKPQAEKTQYQNSTIPDSINYQQQLNDCLELENTNFIVTYDFGHVSILLEDSKVKSEVYKNTVDSMIDLFINNGCTYYDYLVAVGYEDKGAVKRYFYQMEQDFRDSFIKTKTQTNEQSN